MAFSASVSMQSNSLLLFIHLVFHSTASVEGDRGSPRPLSSWLCYAMAFSVYTYFCSNFPFPQTSDILAWGFPFFSMTSSPLYDICSYPTSKKIHIGGTLWLDFSMSFGEDKIPPKTWLLWRNHFIKEGENSLLSKGVVDWGSRQIKPSNCGVRNKQTQVTSI